MPYALAEKKIDFELPDGWKMVGSPHRVRAGGISHAWRVVYRRGSMKTAPTLITTVGVHSGTLLDWRYIP